MLKARLLFVNQLLGSVIAEEIFTMPEVNMLLRTKPRPPFEHSHQAIECERLAAQAQDPGVKAALVSIARQWLELARQVAKLERDR